MLRPIEQRQTPKRRAAARHDPRTQTFGFTARQWPFLYVLVGNWLFSGLFFAIAKLLWHWTPDAWTLGDRIALVIKDAVFAILPAVLAICDSAPSAHAVEKAWNAAGVPGMATRLRFDTSGAKLVAD